jgi:hypothetical protein
MDLIGNDSSIQELAAMCWPSEKRNESIKDGNNRDPSRGSLDAEVCLNRFEQCSLYDGIKEAKNKYHDEGVRIVILGGATGGMGSSLIVPLAKKLREHFDKIRVDLVILGTYFSIPTHKKSVDNIGTSVDSFYRVADQIEELSTVLDNTWKVYYTAMPFFDDICGEFLKNGANKRKSHLLELLSGIAAFDLEKEAPGFYGTALNYDIKKNDAVVAWTDIPFGTEIQTSVMVFMKLMSTLTRVMGSLSQDKEHVKGDSYLKEYLNNKPADHIEIIEAMRDILKVWLVNVKPYFDFWYEVQTETRLGRKSGRSPITFFPENDIKTLADMLNDSISDSIAKQAQNYGNILPFGENFNNYVAGLNTDKKQIKEKLSKRDAAARETAQALLGLMMQDIYKNLSAKKSQEVQ